MARNVELDSHHHARGPWAALGKTRNGADLSVLEDRGVELRGFLGFGIEPEEGLDSLCICHRHRLLSLPLSRMQGWRIDRRPENQLKDLDRLRQLEEVFRVLLKVVDARWIRSGEARHRRHVFPVRNGHELRLGRAVLAQKLHAERLFLERADAELIEIALVFVGAIAGGAAAPDARDGGFGHDRPSMRRSRKRRSGSWRASASALR